MQLLLLGIFLLILSSSNILVFCEESLIVTCFIAFVFSIYVNIEKQWFHQQSNFLNLHQKTSSFSLLTLRISKLLKNSSNFSSLYQLVVLTCILECALFTYKTIYDLFISGIIILTNFFFTEINQAFLNSFQKRVFSSTFLQSSLFLTPFC